MEKLGGNADTQALDRAIRQNAIREGLVSMLFGEAERSLMGPRATSTEMLEEIRRPLPTDRPE